jgi:hypothetical protein
MTEEQPTDVSPAGSTPLHQPPHAKLPTQPFTSVGTAPATDQLGRSAVDADAITERHVFAESEDQLRDEGRSPSRLP